MYLKYILLFFQREASKERNGVGLQDGADLGYLRKHVAKLRRRGTTLGL